MKTVDASKEKSPDSRSIARYDSMLSRMIEKRSCILRQLSLNWNEEMGYWRLLKNTKFSVGWLIERSLIAQKVQEHVVNRHVLSIQDSSTIGFQVRASQKKGLTAIGCQGNRPGFIVHPNLILDAQDGRCLGLGAVSILDQWVAKGNACEMKHVQTCEKKTGRWLESGKAARHFLKEAQTITHIADREADFYEMLLEFGQTRQVNEHLIVRVCDDRYLGHMEGRGKSRNKPEEKVQTTLSCFKIYVQSAYSSPDKAI